MKRKISEKRFFDEKKKRRKIKILKHRPHFYEKELENEVFLGKLVKGKIHCSCKMCQTKTRKDGHKASERRKTFK